ncbi:MAG: molybdenum cofactor guanylyltransferase [Kofleriaceae bacterium]
MVEPTVSALILAGGKATRLGGIAKHELVIEGRTIFERQVAVLAPRVVEILVSGAAVAGYRSVVDRVANAGPLAGIAAGLAATTTEWLLIVAGDMPDLTGELVDALVAARAPELDAVGLRIGERPEPLCCLLHVRTRESLDRRLAAGRFKASGLLTDEGLRVRWLTDADPAALRNLNSPSDLPR